MFMWVEVVDGGAVVQDGWIKTNSPAINKLQVNEWLRERYYVPQHHLNGKYAVSVALFADRDGERSDTYLMSAYDIAPH